MHPPERIYVLAVFLATATIRYTPLFTLVEMFISYTQLELKSFWKLFSFLSISNQARIQAEKASGNCHAATSSRGLRLFVTLTAWESKEDMLLFMRNGAHAEAMRESAKYAKSVLTTSFELESIPGWEEAHERLEKSLKDG